MLKSSSLDQSTGLPKPAPAIGPPSLPQVLTTTWWMLKSQATVSSVMAWSSVRPKERIIQSRACWYVPAGNQESAKTLASDKC
jgi:hypothetical protein